MKTPRDILFSRHASANEKLDAIRREAVQVAAAANRRKPPVREFTVAAAILQVFAVPFRELIWRPRRVWAAFAAVWLMIVGVNLADADHSAAAPASAQPPPAGFFMSWEQQERLLAELAGQRDAPEADRPRTAAPRPRSEYRCNCTSV